MIPIDFLMVSPIMFEYGECERLNDRHSGGVRYICRVAACIQRIYFYAGRVVSSHNKRQAPEKIYSRGAFIFNPVLGVLGIWPFVHRVVDIPTALHFYFLSNLVLCCDFGNGNLRHTDLI